VIGFVTIVALGGLVVWMQADVPPERL